MTLKIYLEEISNEKSRLVVFGITVLTILAVIVTCSGMIKDNMRLGLDLQGGFEILYEVSPLDGKKGAKYERSGRICKQTCRCAWC